MAVSHTITRFTGNRAYHAHSVIDMDGADILLSTQTIGLTASSDDSDRQPVTADTPFTYSPTTDEDIYVAGRTLAAAIEAGVTGVNAWCTRISRTMIRINVLPKGSSDVQYTTMTTPTIA